MHPFARVCLAAAALSLFFFAPTLAEAKVHITVDLDKQTMHVDAGARSFDSKVSSGKRGYETPAGNFHVLWMDKDHHSDEYDQAYMPNAIFFAPGFAIHGFGKSPWGHKASHGCVRIPVAKSAILFEMVKAEGAEVTITGYSPTVAPTVASVAEARAARGDGATTDGQDDSDAPDAAPPRAAAPAPAVSNGPSLFGLFN